MSTLYMNLPYVNDTPDKMRNDLNMMNTIKIKLLRAGLFNPDRLSNINLGNSFILKGIDIGVDRIIHIWSNIQNSDRIQEFRQLATAWTLYVLNHLDEFRQFLTPIEAMFIRERIATNADLPLFASLESYSPGEYVIRV